MHRRQPAPLRGPKLSTWPGNILRCSTCTFAHLFSTLQAAAAFMAWNLWLAWQHAAVQRLQQRCVHLCFALQAAATFITWKPVVQLGSILWYSTCSKCCAHLCSTLQAAAAFMARKPVVELARRQMERNLGYWLLRMCKLSAEHGGWEHTHMDHLVYRITEGDKVSFQPRLQRCWR